MDSSPLVSACVRPHLEYCAWVLALQYEIDTDNGANLAEGDEGAGECDT